MKSNWTNNQIKNLFSLVEKYKNMNKPLLDAFEEFAKTNNKKVFSVRNYYYKKCDEFLSDIKLQKQFDINIKLHEKNNFAKFDERQTDKLINFIKRKKEQGYSVRNACLMLAENDATKLIRFQNKYRQITKQNQKNFRSTNLSNSQNNIAIKKLNTNKNIIENTSEIIKNNTNNNNSCNNNVNVKNKNNIENISQNYNDNFNSILNNIENFNKKCEKNDKKVLKTANNLENNEKINENDIFKQSINFNEDIKNFDKITNDFDKPKENITSENVLSFPSNKPRNYAKLTDLEIQSLFSGLVNLIKKSTETQIQENIKNEQNKLSVVVRNTAIELNKKEEHIDKLLLENKKLTSKVLALQEKIDKLRISQIKKIDLEKNTN